MEEAKILRKVLGPEEAAKELGVSLGLMYRLLRNGKIPHVRAGDRYLISSAALARWVEGQSTPAVSGAK